MKLNEMTLEVLHQTYYKEKGHSIVDIIIIGDFEVEKEIDIIYVIKKNCNLIIDDDEFRAKIVEFCAGDGTICIKFRIL